MSLVQKRLIEALILERSGTPTGKALRPNWKLYPNLSQYTSQTTCISDFRQNTDMMEMIWDPLVMEKELHILTRPPLPIVPCASK